MDVFFCVTFDLSGRKILKVDEKGQYSRNLISFVRAGSVRVFWRRFSFVILCCLRDYTLVIKENEPALVL